MLSTVSFLFASRYSTTLHSLAHTEAYITHARLHKHRFTQNTCTYIYGYIHSHIHALKHTYAKASSSHHHHHYHRHLQVVGECMLAESYHRGRKDPPHRVSRPWEEIPEVSVHARAASARAPPQ